MACRGVGRTWGTGGRGAPPGSSVEPLIWPDPQGQGELGWQSAGMLYRNVFSNLFADSFLGGMGLSFSSLCP